MQTPTTVDAVQMLTLAVGTVLPVLVALVTTKVTDPGVKGVLLATLAAVTAFAGEALTAAQGGTVFDLGRAGVMALGVWVVAVATHFGLWKPTQVSAGAAEKGRTVKGDGE